MSISIIISFSHYLISCFFTSLGRDISKLYCESKMDRGMFWNWTMVGEVVKQPCPGGTSGLARWKCVGNEQNNMPTWFPESPDLSDCKSQWLLSLQVAHFFFLSSGNQTHTYQRIAYDILDAIMLPHLA